jgi:cytochrome c biogenesis protein CcdA
MSFSLLAIAVYAGGMLTIVSPCILPVLPFVFTSAGRPFVRWVGPMLLGLVCAFVVIAVIGVLGAVWLAEAADVGRWAALGIVALAGLMLSSIRVTAVVTRPLVRLGSVMERRSASLPGTSRSLRVGPLTAFTLGCATGLLWAPCAGPLLGLVIALAASRAAPGESIALFIAFGLGAATAMLAVLAASARVLALLRRAGFAERWGRRGIGALSIAAALLIALGWDAPLLSRVRLTQTSGAEESILHHLAPGAKHAVARALGGAGPDGSASTVATPVSTPRR